MGCALSEHSWNVLVVDDDPSIVDLMRDFLGSEGFRVHTAGDAKTASATLEREDVSCVLLDVMLPGPSGFDLCREIRQRLDIPILFLSARQSDVDKIRGLRLGGDDYVVKSASPAEVIARVKAVLRRYDAHEATEHEHLDFGGLVIDLQAHEVRVEGHAVDLTQREFEVLAFLAAHPRQVITYERLLDRFWESTGDRHTVAVTIGRIREKIERDPSEPCWIVNVWGIGYRFEGQRR